MGRFANLGAAKVGRQSRYFSAGRYKCRVEAISIVESRKKKTLFTLETTILDVLEGDAKPGRCSYQVDMAQDYADGNIKEILASVEGMDPQNAEEMDSLTEEDWEELGELAVSAENPMKGKLIEVYAFDKEKRTKPGEMYTRVRFSPTE